MFAYMTYSMICCAIVTWMNWITGALFEIFMLTGWPLDTPQINVKWNKSVDKNV